MMLFNENYRGSYETHVLVWGELCGVRLISGVKYHT